MRAFFIEILQRGNKSMKYQKIRGTADFLPEETNKWQYVESKIEYLLEKYSYQEIRLPVFEQFELFARGVGETSDIVSKEMYEFYDRGDRHLALRPEGTEIGRASCRERV